MRNDVRCPWPGDDPLMIAYHDREWGVPVHDDVKLFEFMVLDAFQAGLSWRTVLRRKHDLLRLHAGRRHGQRPPRDMLPLRQLVARGDCQELQGLRLNKQYG
ncbi:MAG: DNA-3-methyladenine glycosylase I [Deltaproteobacteria bacterium]|nr:DNA-3-methyladenine glycosylase I [Deltaproteobacteria bacterium]